jgi:hypothetical protein
MNNFCLYHIFCDALFVRNRLEVTDGPLHRKTSQVDICAFVYWPSKRAIPLARYQLQGSVSSPLGSWLQLANLLVPLSPNLSTILI